MHIHDLILLVIESEGEKGLRGRTMTEEQRKMFIDDLVYERQCEIAVFDTNNLICDKHGKNNRGPQLTLSD